MPHEMQKQTFLATTDSSLALGLAYEKDTSTYIYLIFDFVAAE
jgi:hypothetical protein